MASWGARLKAAWRGDVSDADLGAMFAATAGLNGLHQALEDRRLAAQIDNAGHDWRVILAVGKIAAPLWLADALIALAGAFYDTETQSHPDVPDPPNRPVAVSSYTHDLVATLLAPVTDIIADVAAALADPTHPTALVAPLRVGPGGDLAAYPLPSPIPALYARGLATGARHLYTSAAVSVGAAQQAINTSPSPEWLMQGLRRLDGELQAAGARLDVAEVLLAPLLNASTSEHAPLTAVCRDLWMIVDAAMVAGQLASDPHLLPDARLARPVDASPAATPPPPPLSPPPVPKRERTHAPVLPQIAEGAPSPRDAWQSPQADRAAAVSSREVALPEIVEGPDAMPPAQPLPAVSQPVHIALPSVGEPPQTTGPAPAPPAESSQDASSTPPKSGGSDGEALISFPDIG